MKTGFMGDQDGRKRARGPGTDTSAFHSDKALEIDALTNKATPVEADVLILEDSADSYNKKKVGAKNLHKAVNPTNGTLLYRNSLGTFTELTIDADALIGANVAGTLITFNSSTGTWMGRRASDSNHQFLTSQQVREELQIGFVLWAEENAALADNTYEWSWGNGGVPGSGEGFVSPYAGKLIGMGLFTNSSSSATVRLEASTSGSLGSVSTSAANSGSVTGLSATFGAGELLTFKTVTAGGASTGPNVVNAFVVFNI